MTQKVKGKRDKFNRKHKIDLLILPFMDHQVKMEYTNKRKTD